MSHRTAHNGSVPLAGAVKISNLHWQAVHHSGADAARSAPSAATATDLSPSRLLIPGIEVDAAIEARGLDSSRNLATPIDFHDVAWFNQGPLPGQPGNALLNGHVDWWTGSAVFARLAELRPGDAVVVVRADGTRASLLEGSLPFRRP